jgi:hypothetical protein
VWIDHHGFQPDFSTTRKRKHVAHDTIGGRTDTTIAREDERTKIASTCEPLPEFLAFISDSRAQDPHSILIALSATSRILLYADRLSHQRRGAGNGSA